MTEGAPTQPDLAFLVLSGSAGLQKGGSMRPTESGFSVVDCLIIMALLLILAGMIGPYYAQSRASKVKNSPAVTAPVRPAR